MGKKREISDNVVDAAELKAYVARLESLAEQRSVISEDMSEIMKEAKSKGYLPKVIREVLRLRKLEADALKESEGHRTAYIMALGLDDVL